MRCQKLICSLCGGDQIEEKQVKDSEVLAQTFECECGHIHHEAPVCGGEIEKIWRDGKVIDCVCESCGASYGASALDRERILESFQIT